MQPQWDHFFWQLVRQVAVMLSLMLKWWFISLLEVHRDKRRTFLLQYVSWSLSFLFNRFIKAKNIERTKKTLTETYVTHNAKNKTYEEFFNAMERDNFMTAQEALGETTNKYKMLHIYQISASSIKFLRWQFQSPDRRFSNKSTFSTCLTPSFYSEKILAMSTRISPFFSYMDYILAGHEWEMYKESEIIIPILLFTRWSLSLIIALIVWERQLANKLEHITIR